MTIAVQGDWGTGKTNMMQLVEGALAPHLHFRLSDPPEDAPESKTDYPVYTIRFNTWQYSQFDMQGRLVGSLLENIGAHLLLADPGTGRVDKRKAFFGALVPIATTAGLSILKAGLSTVGLGAVKDVLVDVESETHKALAARTAAPLEDAAAVLVNVKAKFAAAVEELVARGANSSAARNGRLVVFIDDLDRLEPRKAVELMESLKLFLDVPHCVFVLAIDFSVVQQGVVDKYGDRMGREKARSFFDKIIQVPFQMPVGAYAIDEFLTELITATRLDIGGPDRGRFLSLIQYSVGSNPRSIKRLMNTFMLLRDIARISRAGGGSGQIADLQLFAVLCLQTAYPDAYLELASGSVEDSEIFQRYFMVHDGDVAEQEDQPDQAGADERLAAAGIEPGGKRFRLLAEVIAGQFSLPGDRGLDTATFEWALGQALTTSSGSESAPMTTQRGPKVYGADNRRERMTEKYEWAVAPDALLLPEAFCRRLESDPQVSVGVPVNDARGWVIQLAGKRVGMVHVRQKFVHVSLEPRWFAEPESQYFLQKFEERFPSDSELRKRMKSNPSGGFIVSAIRPSELGLLDTLADYWLDVIREDLAKR